MRINWARELTFSERQVGYISRNVPDARGVYCIYAKDYRFDYASPEWSTARWSRVVYIGCGWLHKRLCSHLRQKKNYVLTEYLDNYELAYRYDRIVDTDEHDWSRTIEAGLLGLFIKKFGSLPPANRREETFPELDLDGFLLDESPNFSVLTRG